MDPRYEATCREVCLCLGSYMGKRIDLKVLMSDSSTTIWRGMKWQ